LPPVAYTLRWRALLGREAALNLLGDRDAEQADLDALDALADRLDDDARRAEAHYRRQVLFGRTGNFRADLSIGAQALAEARRTGNLALEARILGDTIVAHTRLHELDAARSLLDSALACARASGDSYALGVTLKHLGVHYAETGEIAQAIELNREVTELARQSGDRALECSPRGNLGYCYALLGLYREARAELERAVRLAESIGNRRDRSYHLANLGWTHLRSGDGRTARRLLEEALVGMNATGDESGRAWVHVYMAELAEASGDVSAAARRYAQAQDGFNALDARPLAIQATAGLARAALAQAQFDSARGYVHQVWEYLSGHGAEGIELATLCYQTCADLFDALGEAATARAAVEAGYHELMARAEKITKPEWRASFLENVAEHRAIVELWERSRA
jgi:tetratricopeptide (TPR) repeat protein